MYGYAHKDTREGERVSPTAQFNTPKLSGELQALRDGAFRREIPTSDDETLCFLITLVKAIKPLNILELGAAVGISGIAMLNAGAGSFLTTVEKNADFAKEAGENFHKAGLSDRVNLIEGDAGEVINSLPANSFDMIFLDCAKVQYVKYLPRLKELLKAGGALVADDVLLFGYVAGEAEIPKKRKMLVEHIREYISAVRADGDFTTTVINAGNGIALSVKNVPVV